MKFEKRVLSSAIVAATAFLSLSASAAIMPMPEREPASFRTVASTSLEDALLDLSSMGVDLDDQQTEAITALSRDVNFGQDILSNLMILVDQYPKQAQAWLNAVPHVFNQPLMSEELKQSMPAARAEYLNVALKALYVEGAHPEVFSKSSIVATFGRYADSATSIKNVNSIVKHYVQLVTTEGESAGRETFKKASLDFIIGGLIEKNHLASSEMTAEEKHKIAAEAKTKFNEVSSDPSIFGGSQPSQSVLAQVLAKDAAKKN